MNYLSRPQLALMNAMTSNLGQQGANLAALQNQQQQVRQRAGYTPLTNPWTQFGAALMAGSDPYRQGAGGIGSALMHTAAYVQAMEQAERERAWKEQQIALTRAQFQLQMEAEAAKRAHAQKQAQQLERYVSTFPEEEQAAVRTDPEAFAQAQARAKYRKPPEETNARRLFREMGGQQGTGKTFPQWYATDYKTGTNITISEVKEPVRNRLLQYGSMEQQLNRLSELLGEHGTEVVPTKAKARMRTAYKALTIEAKNLFELGALSGPDYELITDTISDPTAIQAAAIPASHYQAQLDEVRRILEGAKRRFRQTLPEEQRGMVDQPGDAGNWQSTGSGARWRVK